MDNPVDLGMASGFNPQWYSLSIEALAQDPNTDMILVIGGRNGGLSRTLAGMVKETKKPLVVAMTQPMELAVEDYRLFFEDGVPAYADGRRAARALGWLADRRDYLESATQDSEGDR